MRLAATLTGSIAAHVAVGALLFVRFRHPALEAPTTTTTTIAIDPAPAIAGDTFEMPRDEQTEIPVETNVADTPTDDTPGDRPAVQKSGGAKSSTSSHTQSSSAAASAVLPSQYGAVGQRGSFELVPTFARAYVQAASSDPAWSTAPLGDAGSVDMTFTIDATGALVGTVTGGTGSAPLRRGIERTMALIAGRTFYANAAETHVRVHARIAPDEVHDGLHGDVFAIGMSGSSAFFALAIGRRIDIDVTPVR